MDPISDFIVKIKNAADADIRPVSVPYSKIKFELAKILEREGFIQKLSTKGKDPVSRFIEFEISYDSHGPKINGVERISKFSKRVYLKNKELASGRKGRGRLILSTSKGLMTDREAAKERSGGEALFRIW